MMTTEGKCGQKWMPNKKNLLYKTRVMDYYLLTDILWHKKIIMVLPDHWLSYIVPDTVLGWVGWFVS